MKISIFLALLLIVSLALASCGRREEAPAAAPPPETISVVMHDIYYGDDPNNMQNPPAWTVTNGAQVTLNMNNQGALEHDWAIVKPGQNLPVPFMMEQHKDMLLYEAGLVAAGNTENVTFTAPAAGEYTVICTVAGHYPAMQGKLVVQ